MFIKLHDWMIKRWKTKEESIIFALIHQMSEIGPGWWAGYAALSDTTDIPKKDCKIIIGNLKKQNAISESRMKINEKTRIVWRTNQTFFQ